MSLRCREHSRSVVGHNGPTSTPQILFQNKCTNLANLVKDNLQQAFTFLNSQSALHSFKERLTPCRSIRQKNRSSHSATPAALFPAVGESLSQRYIVGVCLGSAAPDSRPVWSAVGGTQAHRQLTVSSSPATRTTHQRRQHSRQRNGPA